MFEPNPQKLSIRNEDIVKFHNSFFFFSHLLRYQPCLTWLSKIIILFTYLQIFVCTLTAPIIDHLINQKKNFLEEVYYIFLHYSKSSINFENFKYLIFIQSVFLIIISCFIFFMFYAYVRGYRISRFLTSLRGFLIILSPSNIVIPIILHVSFAIRCISDVDCSEVNITITIVFSFVILVVYSSIFIWASPLLLKTPFLSMAHVPSPLLPDLFDLKSIIIYAIVMSTSLASSTKRSFIFYLCFSTVFGIYRFYRIWKRPYSSTYDTVFGLALSLSMISNPLLYLIPYCAHRMSDGLYFGLMIVIFVVFLIISYIFFVSRQNNAMNNIRSSNFEKVLGDDIFFYAQTSLIYGELSQELVSHIYDCYKIKPSNDILIVYCYCFILTANQLEIDVLDQSLSALVHVSSLSWPKQFIVFELYRSFAQTMSLPVPIPRLSDVDALTKKYWEIQGQFWERQIDGDINTAMKYLHKMNSIYMKANYLYEKIRQFYRRHPRVVQFEINFFAPRRRHIRQRYESSSSISDMTCDIQQMYSRFIKRQSVTTMTYDKQRKDDATGTTAATATTTGTTVATPVSMADSIDSRTMTQISMNLHKFLERPLPFRFYLFGAFTFLIFVAVFTILAYPVFEIFTNSKFLSMVPIAFNHMRQIVLSYSNINIAIKHVSDCTIFVTINCEEIFNEMGIPFNSPPWVECKTVRNVVENLTNTAIQTQKWLETYSEIMEDFQSNKDIESLFRSWYIPLVPLFPETASTDHSILDNAKLDLRTALVLFTSDIIRLAPNNDSSSACISSYANFTHQNKADFFNVSTTLQIDLINSLQGFKAYILSLKNEYTSKRETYIYIIIAILIVISVIVFDFMIFLRESYIYTILDKHFRPSKNPYTDKAPETFNESEPFNFRWKSLLYPTIIVLFIYLCFLIQFFFIYDVIIDSRDEIANECEAIIEIGNVTLHTSLEIVAYLRYFENDTDPIIYDNLIETQNKLIDSITMMDIAISPLKIKRLWNKDPLIVETDRCARIGVGNFTIHDVQACWPLSRQVSVFFFYFLTFLNRTGPKLISSQLFLNAQHIYISHLMDDFADLASDFDHFSIITKCELVLFCMIEIGFYIIFLVIALLCTVYFGFVEFSALNQQINRIFKVLMPKFIASQQCLMSFIITENKENDSKREISPSFFSFYDDADLAVVVVSDRLMIVSFTHGVQTLFGYRAEQLIGQPLTILIPKTMSNNVSHNSSSFYQQIASIKKRQAEPVTTRDLLGRSSDGTEIQLHVRASLAEVDDLDFFVIEFKSLADLFYYDMLIQKHKDMFEEIMSMSMPRSLFPEINDDSQYTAVHYDNFILLYITSSKSEAYSSLTVGMDLSEIKAKVESVIPYFDGSGGAIVLDVSCSHACVLFVDYTGDVNQLFSDAWQFLTTYLSADSATKAGIIIKGGGTIPNIDMYYDPDSIGNVDDEIDNQIHLNPNENNEMINDNINNNINLNDQLNNMDSDSQEEISTDDEDEDDYESGVDIVMFAPPQVPPQFANIQSPIEESKKFIPTMTLEPFSQIFYDLPQLIEMVKPNKIILSQELCEFVEDAHFTEVVTDLPYKLASIDILTEPQLPT